MRRYGNSYDKGGGVEPGVGLGGEEGKDKLNPMVDPLETTDETRLINERNSVT